MAPSFTLGNGVLQAAVTALTNADTALAPDIAAISAVTAVVPPGTDQVSIAQAAAIDAWGATLQTALANGQSYATQFIANLSNASDTYSFAEATNAASATASAAAGSGGAGDGGVLTTISQLLGGPSGSLNGNPFSLSSNTANIGNIGAGNWASAMSDLLGMAGGGLLPAGSDTIGDAGVAAALASDTTPVGVGVGGMGGFGAMPMGAMGGGTLVGNLSAPPSWAGTITPVAGTVASPLQTVGFTGAAPQAAAGTGMAGMPGMVTGGAGRSSAGFGAPRYGVKPIVMPKLATV